jgi:23S rRNA pseudouridine2457 synthase
LNHAHYILYKPFGYLSQFKTNARKKKLLGELYPFAEGTMAIGRLDEDSEGLLLLTTDGKLSEYIRSRTIEKEYYVQTDGSITENALAQLKQGVAISIKGQQYVTTPCKACMLDTFPNLPPRGKNIRSDRHGPTSWVSITLTEGKLRQARKMTAAVGFPTLRLVRVRIGNILLGNMQPGDVIQVNELNVDGNVV